MTLYGILVPPTVEIWSYRRKPNKEMGKQDMRRNERSIPVKFLMMAAADHSMSPWHFIQMPKILFGFHG